MGRWSDRVLHFDELPSTMTTAREMARAGCPAFSVVVADRQSQGRGRLSRKWDSDSGGLYFTTVVRPAIPPQLAPRVNFAASLAMALTLRGSLGLDSRLK